MTEAPRDLIICLPEGGGRRYAMGQLTAFHVADGDETDDQSSAFEWLLDPAQPGVRAHMHEPDEEIFLAFEGAPEFLPGGTLTPCPKGAFMRIPASVTHGFHNLTPRSARFFGRFIGEGFERHMPSINWFAAQEAPA